MCTAVQCKPKKGPSAVAVALKDMQTKLNAKHRQKGSHIQCIQDSEIKTRRNTTNS
jgi:hypothetical protein